MKLVLDREDLRPEHKNINCSKTKWEHFDAYTQEAIRTVGKATFQEYDQGNYNVIEAGQWPVLPPLEPEEIIYLAISSDPVYVDTFPQQDLKRKLSNSDWGKRNYYLNRHSFPGGFIREMDPTYWPLGRTLLIRGVVISPDEEKETVTMPDGFGADTIKLYTAPIETDGHLVKLACAVPGKEYMIKWARKSDIEKALKGQS